MKTIDIKGKKYVTVNERLIYFREKYENFALVSEIVELTDDRVVIKASVIESNGFVWATGHAYEDKDSTFINKTSFIENCETSAWGRALANFGIGIEESVASADEVINAKNNNEEKPTMGVTIFNEQCNLLNREPDKEKRRAHANELVKRYKISPTHRAQLGDIVNQRDINV